MSEKAKIGMMGCGVIGRKNALSILRATNAELVAVASRDQRKCDQYCDELLLPQTVARLGSYEAILADKSIDIVYLPLPTTIHLEWVLKAAEAGKHIIVEKPVALSLEDLKKMILACRKAGVQLMDGLMFIHHARFTKIRAIFDDVLTWQPVRVSAAFTFKASASCLEENIRVKADGDPLGCLGDLGWYCTRVGLAAFRWEQPVAVAARLHAATDAGVPLDMDVDVYWPEASAAVPAWVAQSSSGDGGKRLKVFTPQRMLTFHVSFLHPWRQWYEAVSHDGKVVRCRDLCIPKREQYCEFEVEQTIGTSDVDRTSVSDCTVVPTLDCAQEVCMWERIASIALSKAPDHFWERVMLLNQAVIDAALISARSDGRRVDVASVDLDSTSC